MNLQSRIYKISNDLISIFSIMDSWFDRGKSFLNSKQFDSLISAGDLQKKVSLMTENIICDFGNNDTSGKANALLSNIEMGFEDIDVSVYHVMAMRRTESVDDAVKEILRDQLFEMLCLLDETHTKVLDPFQTSDDMLVKVAAIEHWVALCLKSVQRYEMAPEVKDLV